MKKKTLISICLAMCSVVFADTDVPKRGVLMEVWDDVRTGMVSALLEVCETKKPNAAYIREGIDEVGSQKDYFGARFSALLTPPESGEYTFYLAADDTAELLLSTDATPENLRKVCEVRSYTPRHHFVPHGNSCKVTLSKGTKYYLVVHYKEAINDEHVSLAWEGPGLRAKQVIQSKYLEPCMNPEQRALWERTTRNDKQGSELLQKLRGMNPSAIMDWLNKLSPQEQQLLEQKLIREQSRCLSKNDGGIKQLVRMASGIVATPESPVHNPVAKRLLDIEEAWLKTLSNEELVELGPHRLAHSLGSIPKDARRVKYTQKLNSSGEKWMNELVSLGVYAAPGKPFTITIPEELADKKLQVQVGHHFPEKKNPYVSMPSTTRRFLLEKACSTFVTPHGGLMMLSVPKEVELKRTPVIVEGALRAPRFILGRHTDEDWKKIRKAPAPWGELVSEYVVLIVPRDVLRKLENPTAVMSWWNTNNRDLQDFYSYYPKIPFRMHSGHYAEEGISYWPLQWAPKNMAYLLNLEAMKEKNSALFLHEHGHHCDFWEMELSFWAESTPNWGGYYMRERKGKHFNWKDSHDLHLRKLFDVNDAGMNEIRQDAWYKISTKGTHHWSYPITSMMIGYADAFGWGCIKATIKRIRDKEGDMYKWQFVQGADHDQAKIDRYLIGLSEAAQRDVRPYFAHFKMFPSEGAALHLDNLKLKPWDATYFTAPAETRVARNQKLSIPCGPDTLLGFAKQNGIRWKKMTAAGGTVVRKGGNKVIYTPSPDFSGVDYITYEVFNQYGCCAQKQLKVLVK